MISITYISRAERRFTDQELFSMLKRFQDKNAASGITGVLLYNGVGTFIQVIEGEADKIESLFDQIKKDSRHSRIVCLRKATVQNRSFKDWRMGYRNLQRDAVEDASCITVFLNDEKLENFVSQDTDFAMKVLTSFRNKTQEMIF